MKPHRAICLAFFAMQWTAGAARAQQAATGDITIADALFLEGKQLVDEHRDIEACARFEASRRLAPRLGVELNLADCYQRVGRTASAWVTFGEAAARAHSLADSREVYALSRREALAPRLSRLAIGLDAKARAPDLVVERDGIPQPPSAYGVAIPVDPGEHTVAVTAPGRVPWSSRVTIAHEGATVWVAVPELARLEAVATPAAPVDAGRRRPATAFWVATGVSVMGLGIGTYFGLAGRSLWQNARSGCDPSNACTGRALDAIARSRRDGDIATAAFVVAGVAVAAGAVLYLRSPRDTGGVWLTPAAPAGSVGLTIGGQL